MKFLCDDDEPKFKYVIFNEELWLCAKHYSQIQNEIFDKWFIQNILIFIENHNLGRHTHKNEYVMTLKLEHILLNQKITLKSDIFRRKSMIIL